MGSVSSVKMVAPCHIVFEMYQKNRSLNFFSCLLILLFSCFLSFQISCLFIFLISCLFIFLQKHSRSWCWQVPWDLTTLQPPLELPTQLELQRPLVTPSPKVECPPIKAIVCKSIKTTDIWWWDMKKKRKSLQKVKHTHLFTFFPFFIFVQKSAPPFPLC